MILKSRIDEMRDVVYDKIKPLREEQDEYLSKGIIVKKEDRIKLANLRHELGIYENDIQNVNFLRIKKSFKKEYSKENFDIDELYIDQAPIHSKYYYMPFSSVYLKYGLQQLEGSLIRMIIDNPYDFSKEKISEMIKRNPHLHNIIKTNLLDNLNNKT